jgi:hypothetical protein
MTAAENNTVSFEDRALIEQQCTSLSYAFAHHVDHEQVDELVALFTEDGVFDRGAQVLSGHAELLEGMSVRPPMTTRHLFTNFFFDSVERDVATAYVYCMTYHAHGDFTGETMVYATANGRLVELRDEYRRTPEGWRIARRGATPVFQPDVWP